MRHAGPGVRGRSGGQARRQQPAGTWPVPPRYTRWDVVPGARLELRDASGALLAWLAADRALAAVHGPGDRPLVAFRPAVAGHSSLQDVPAGLTFARIGPCPGGAAQVGMLPPGRLNDKRLALALSPGRVAQLRQGSPLRYAVDPLGAAELSDPAGRVLARADGGVAGGPPRSIEVGDNDLPVAWLFAIVLGCRGWQR